MDVGIFDAAWQALLIILEPHRLAFLFLGVVMGLALGILPGIGGMAGTALLLPFTFAMDPYTAVAFLLGLAAVTSTGDPIPAILFGVPGGAGSAATVLDGLPMAKRGEAGRALSAAYMSSLMGGLFGAALLGIALPVMRPIILYFGSPELLAFSVFGISLVALLSGNAPLRGLTVACFGILLAMVGTAPQTGTPRWTFDTLYLFEGVPLVPIVLGVFALPELCDLAISRTALAARMKYNASTGLWLGAKDCFRHWWLVVRCSWIGAGCGSIPGIGGPVIDWIAYAHARRTEKGAQASFGTGDVRGVIASESSNNAKESGALVPTIAFGIPGSPGMTILLAAFLTHGIVPGPNMMTKNLDFTYSMVWSIALANILGAGLCYLLSGQFAKLATLRYTLVLPTVLCIIYVGAFEGSRSWGDLHALLFFGVLGWTMKQLKWPRPPFILGFVLGDLIERYLFISINRYGFDWISRPVVIVLFVFALLGLLRSLTQDIRSRGGRQGIFATIGAPRFRLSDLLPVAFIAASAAMAWTALDWRLSDKIVPIIVGTLCVGFAAISLAARVFIAAPATANDLAAGLHMDIDSGTSDVPPSVVSMRAAMFFGWMLAFMASMALIGLIPTVPIFVVAFMRMENREPWMLVLLQAVSLTLFIYIVFDQLLSIPWPGTVLGDLFPELKALPSV